MSAKVIGFTGTRESLTHWQLGHLQDVFRYQKPTEIHHGDCVGADAMVHAIASVNSGIRIVVHPPKDERLRAFCRGENVTVLDPLPFIERNHAIVDACEIVIALPQTEEEQQRSGTWATARYALKQSRRLMLIHPGGIARWVDDRDDLARKHGGYQRGRERR